MRSRTAITQTRLVQAAQTESGGGECLQLEGENEIRQYRRARDEREPHADVVERVSHRASRTGLLRHVGGKKQPKAASEVGW